MSFWFPLLCRGFYCCFCIPTKQ